MLDYFILGRCQNNSRMKSGAYSERLMKREKETKDGTKPENVKNEHKN